MAHQIETGTHVNLIFSCNSEQRALAEVYATADSLEKLVKVWTKGYEPRSL